jgi:cysteine synthase A
MIDLTVHAERLQRAVRRARERGILVPTFAQMKDPAGVPVKVSKELAGIGLWDLHPRNLFPSPGRTSPARAAAGSGA